MMVTPDNASADGPPDWRTPPQMIGGHVAGPLLIARSAELVMVARHILAYPVGFEVEIEANARGPLPESFPGGSLPDPTDFAWPSQLSFRLRLADGTDVAQEDKTGFRGGQGPMMVLSKSESGSGGPDNHEYIHSTLWIWPLPPPGPLTLTCSWPSRGLRDANLVLDADAIRAAAIQAQPFWPETP